MTSDMDSETPDMDDDIDLDEFVTAMFGDSAPTEMTGFEQHLQTLAEGDGVADAEGGTPGVTVGVLTTVIDAFHTEYPEADISVDRQGNDAAVTVRVVAANEDTAEDFRTRLPRVLDSVVDDPGSVATDVGVRPDDTEDPTVDSGGVLIE